VRGSKEGPQRAPLAHGTFRSALLVALRSTALFYLSSCSVTRDTPGATDSRENSLLSPFFSPRGCWALHVLPAAAAGGKFQETRYGVVGSCGKLIEKEGEMVEESNVSKEQKKTIWGRKLVKRGRRQGRESGRG